MQLADREIAVIGAGIGGLAAALALARRGARVTVYERAAALAEVGAGLQIAPNGVAVLEALGLRGPAEAVAAVPPAVELVDGTSGRLRARVPLGQAAVARWGRPYWQMHRADLLGVLAAALPEAGVALRLGAGVAAVEPGPPARLALAAGGRVEAELVVAADGVRSGVRAALFGGHRPRFTGHVAWRGLVRGEAVAAPAATTVFMGPGRHLVVYPLRGGRLVNLVAVERRAAWAEEGWSEPDDPAAPARAFAGFGAAARALLASLDDVFLWGLFDHPPLGAWVRGRVALLGDACHPMLPFLAQGATQALEDAWVLAAELDGAPAPEAGLVAYEARRRPRATRVQRAAAGSGRLYHLGGATAAAVHGALGLVPAGLLLRRLDWLYGTDVVSAATTG